MREQLRDSSGGVNHARGLTLAGVALLAGAVALNVATLTTSPAVFIDESWFASMTVSESEGTGLEPSIAADSGVYDDEPDYWAARIGSLPSLAVEEMAATSFTGQRAVILFTGLVALVVFGFAMARLIGAPLALFAAAALAVSYGFVTISHWIRWDAFAALFVVVILLLLVRGPPTRRIAAVLGLLIGLSQDLGLVVSSVFPAIVLLTAWEREDRWPRLGFLAGGLGAGMAVFLSLHVVSDPNAAREQYEVIYEPIYGEMPILSALKGLSLTPLIDEADRYTQMAYTPYIATLVTFAAGMLAGVLTIGRRLGAGRTTLAIAGVAGLCLIAATVLTGAFPYAPIRVLTGLLIPAGVAGLLALAWRALREATPEYPVEAVPAILFASGLFGLGLLMGYKGPAHPLPLIPLAIGALAVGLRELSPERLRVISPAVGLAAAALFAGAYLYDQDRASKPDASLDKRLAERANEIVPSDATVMGDWVYWWLWKDDRFRYNSAIWTQRFTHPDESFADNFNRVCPDFVLLDDLWLNRYLDPLSGRLAPSQAPIYAGERRQLRRFLRKEYRRVEGMIVDERKVVFWKRRAAECPAVPASPSDA